LRSIGVTDLISVIVATYNRPDALEAVLRSLAAQTDRNFEIIVADDGSRAETGRIVAAWAKRTSITVKHVWHEDKGFRLAEIRNRAIRVSTGRYCIFLDGDCLVRPGFVAAHRRLARPGWFVNGSRLLLSRDLTARILQNDLQAERWGMAAWIAERVRGRVNRLGPLLLPPPVLGRGQARRWRGARGSNMAFWRRDLDAVDGFDAAFTGWGREDSDIFVRMIRNGVWRRDGRLGATVLHLWHAEEDRSGLKANQRQLEQLLTEKRVRAQQGLSLLTQSIERSRREPALQ
jgi:glycosyltransferase involved in cell wall biosynthesis